MSKNNKKWIQYENSSLAKIFVYSIFTVILLIIGSVSFAYIANSWNIYGPQYAFYIPGQPGQIIPVYIQSLRALSLACLVLFIFVFILTLLNIFKIQDKKIRKQYFYSLGIFTWLLLPLNFIQARNSYSFQYLIENLLETKRTFMISNHHVKNVLTRKNNAKMNFLFWKTIITYLSFITLFIGFIMIFSVQYQGKYDNTTGILYKSIDDPSTSPIFNIFSYFTELTNIWLFIFIGIMIIRPNSIFFNKNTKFADGVAYIFVVALIYWVGLFPSDIRRFNGFDNFIRSDIIGFIETIFLHAINPILTILVFIFVSFSIKQKPVPYLKMMQTSLIYPALYATYTFTLPFMTQYSTYGIFTNLNPGSRPFYVGTVPSPEGSLAHIVILFGLFVTFMISLFAFWWINNLSSKTKFWRNIKIKKINI